MVFTTTVQSWLAQIISFNNLFPTPIQEALHVPKHITYFVQLENKLTPTCDFLNLIPSSLYENAKILVGPV